MCSARKEWKDAYRSRTVVGGVFRIRCDAARKSWLHGSTDLRGSHLQVLINHLFMRH